MKTLEQYMDLPWRTEVGFEKSGDQVFVVASHPELFSCRGQGLTVGEAIDDLRGAREGMLEMMLENGDPILEPKPLPITVPARFTYRVDFNYMASTLEKVDSGSYSVCVA